MGFSLLASKPASHAWCGPVLVFTMQVTRQTLNGHNQSKNHYTQIHQDKYKGAGRIQYEDISKQNTRVSTNSQSGSQRSESKYTEVQRNRLNHNPEFVFGIKR